MSLRNSVKCTVHGAVSAGGVEFFEENGGGASARHAKPSLRMARKSTND